MNLLEKLKWKTLPEGAGGMDDGTWVDYAYELVDRYGLTNKWVEQTKMREEDKEKVGPKRN